MKRAYDEHELVHNRASLLLYGGTVAERRAWAEEAHAAFEHEAPWVEVTDARQLPVALGMKKGVVYVPDTVSLGRDGQGAILRCLQFQEERAKWVLGLMRPARLALEDGSLRDDLHYRLHTARVDLSGEDVKAAIAKRREGRPAPGRSRVSHALPRTAAKVKR